MKVWIDEGCIGCKLCQEICPEVFEVDETASVIDENIVGNEEAIVEASEECPVEVIIYKLDDEYDVIDDGDVVTEEEEFQIYLL